MHKTEFKDEIISSKTSQLLSSMAAVGSSKKRYGDDFIIERIKHILAFSPPEISFDDIN
jgi:hypothetical protein